MSGIPDLDVFRCDLDGINLIEASAGTGKTWNICGLYLRLLLERGLDVQQILVVTFTNAATAELRERIRTRIVETRDYLVSGIAPGGDPFVPTLVNELAERQKIAEEDLIRRLDLALRTFDEASIFTIHGFCQRALGDNPFAAGLPMAMELIQDDSDLLMESVHDFWRRHIAGDALPAELISFLAGKGDTPERYARLLKRHLAKPLAISLWPDDLDAEPVIDSAALRAAYADVRRLWANQGVAIADFLISSLGSLNGTTHKETSVREGATQWDKLFRTADPLAPFGKNLRLYRDFTLNARKKKAATPPSHPFFTAAETFLALRETIDGALALRRLRLIRALLDEAGDRLRASKQARRVVSFDDMLFNIHNRLTNGSYPWLATSLKARFPAALIDEFQDTDPLQFEIFHAIYGARDTPLFLVGDPKQAIYSFRHADLHTYLRARQHATQESSLVANQRRAALLIYINRFGCNGLYRTNRQGECNTSYGDPKRVPGFQEEALLRFAKRLQPAELCCDDFEKIMEQAEAGDVVYCDPPYAADKGDKRCFTAYGKQGFFWNDQKRLADKARELAERGVRVVISNHDTSSTRELYAGSQLHHLEVRRSIAAQKNSRVTAHELVAVFAPESVAARDSDRTLTAGYPPFCSPPRGSSAVSPGPSGRGV